MADAESQGSLVIQPLGIRPIGAKGKKKNQPIVATWFINPDNNDTVTALQIPGQIATIGSNNGFTQAFKYVLDVASLQGTFIFGKTKQILLNIQRQRAWLEAGGPNYYIPGRIFVYVPSTQQFFVFSAKRAILVPPASGLPAFLPESQNEVLPVFIDENGKIELWIESDSIQGPASNVPVVSITINVYNFDFTNEGEEL